MRIFITGATGVVGRRLVPMLRARGDDVTAVVRSPAKAAALVRAGARPIAVDLFDARAVRDAMLGHDAVINLATHIPSTLRMLLPGAWRENDRLRRVASARLVDTALALDIPRFVQESFAPAYADHGDAWIGEDEPFAPAYADHGDAWIAEDQPIAPISQGRTVVDAEGAVARFIADGRAGVVLRFAAFYGPDSRFLVDMARMIERGWSPLPGPPEAYISSISHDDAATAAFAALDLPAGTYNVSDDEPLRHREFVDSLADALGVPHPRAFPAWLTALTGSIGRLYSRSLRISNARLRAAGWAPRFPSARDGWPEVVSRLPRPAASHGGHPGEART